MDPLSTLRNSLQKDPLPIYVTIGAESLLVREAEKIVESAVVSGPVAAFNHAILSASDESCLRFGDIASSVPMMAPRRLVVIRQIQDANAALLDRLLEYAASPAGSTVLLVSGEKFPAAMGGVDRGLRVQNAVKKTGMVLKLDGEGVDPVGFVVSRAADLGLKLEADAARTLVMLVGDDLSGLAGELEKLVSYVGKSGTIDRAAVEAVVASTAETDVWALTNALVGRQRDKALEALHRLLEDGEASHRLLASVAWQIRQLLTLQDVMRRGLSDRDANLRMNPNVARAMRETLGKVTLSPSGLLEEIAAANRLMNFSRAGDRRVFEGLVLRLTCL